MTDIVVTAHAFPTANDLAGSLAAGWGSQMYEANLAAWIGSLLSQNRIISGFALPANDADLTVTIPSGKVMLAGIYAEVDATNVTFPNTTTSHLFVKLVRNVDGDVFQVLFEHNTTGTPPTNSAKIGTLTAAGGAITSTTDARSYAYVDQARLVKPCVGYPELKFASGTAVTIDGNPTVISMNAYSVFPATFSGIGSAVGLTTYTGSDPSDAIGRFGVDGSGNSNPCGARWYYHSASDDPTMWLLYDPDTGLVRASWASDDPIPTGEPGVSRPGASVRCIKSSDLEAFTELSPYADAAQQLIGNKGWSMAHQAYRALQLLAQDQAPAQWLAEHMICTDATLRVGTPDELAAIQAARTPPLS